MSIEIREFRDSDAAGIAVVHFESFRTYLKERMEDKQPKPAEYWLQFARCVTSPDRISKTYVAVDDSQKVIGFIRISLNLVYGLGTLIQIGVLPESGHHGIGSLLFDAADRFWRAHHARKVYTCVSSINPKAYSFYQKHGFCREGILKDHYFPGVDEFQLGLFYEKLN